MRRFLLFVTLALAGTSCTHTTLARRLVCAPNLQATPSLRFGDMTDAFAAVSVPTRNPEVFLKALVVEPGDWHLAYTYTPKRTERSFEADVQMSFEKPEGFKTDPKGTVILLHGFGQQKEQMLHWALSLAQQGFRSVTVDLRGHGRSSGRWIGYGAFEVEDMRCVLDTLISRRLVSGKVGVLGVSLGASVAIQWAGADPRVSSVVALEPFSDPQWAIESMTRHFPPYRRKLWWASESTIQRAIQDAPREAGFTWAEVDVPKAAKAVNGPILFIHGADDAMVPPQHSHRLSAGAPAGSRVLILPGEDHMSLALQLRPMEAAVHEWFKSHLTGNLPSLPIPSDGRSS